MAHEVWEGRKKRLEEESNKKIQEVLDGLREEVAKAAAAKAPDETIPPPPQQQPKVEETTAKVDKTSLATKPLVYFSFPIMGYNEPPAWVEPLRDVLINMGYFVYNPWENLSEQLGVQDLPGLNRLPKRLQQAICPLLQIPAETLLPFESVAEVMRRGDGGLDDESLVFRDLWFLVRASLVICDLGRPMVGAGTAHEILYARQLAIPTIGLLSGTVRLSPWVRRAVPLLYTDLQNLQNILPLVKGYLPTGI